MTRLADAYKVYRHGNQILMHFHRPPVSLRRTEEDQSESDFPRIREHKSSPEPLRLDYPRIGDRNLIHSHGRFIPLYPHPPVSLHQTEEDDDPESDFPPIRERKSSGREALHLDSHPPVSLHQTEEDDDPESDFPRIRERKSSPEPLHLDYPRIQDRKSRIRDRKTPYSDFPRIQERIDNSTPDSLHLIVSCLSASRHCSLKSQHSILHPPCRNHYLFNCRNILDGRPKGSGAGIYAIRLR